jgi:hypothetical protein
MPADFSVKSLFDYPADRRRLVRRWGDVQLFALVQNSGVEVFVLFDARRHHAEQLGSGEAEEWLEDHAAGDELARPPDQPAVAAGTEISDAGTVARSPSDAKLRAWDAFNALIDHFAKLNHYFVASPEEDNEWCRSLGGDYSPTRLAETWASLLAAAGEAGIPLSDLTSRWERIRNLAGPLFQHATMFGGDAANRAELADEIRFALNAMIELRDYYCLAAARAAHRKQVEPHYDAQATDADDRGRGRQTDYEQPNVDRHVDVGAIDAHTPHSTRGTAAAGDAEDANMPESLAKRLNEIIKLVVRCKPEHRIHQSDFVKLQALEKEAYRLCHARRFDVPHVNAPAGYHSTDLLSIPWRPDPGDLHGVNLCAHKDWLDAMTRLRWRATVIEAQPDSASQSEDAKSDEHAERRAELKRWLQDKVDALSGMAPSREAERAALDVEQEARRLALRIGELELADAIGKSGPAFPVGTDVNRQRVMRQFANGIRQCDPIGRSDGARRPRQEGKTMSEPPRPANAEQARILADWTRFTSRGFNAVSTIPALLRMGREVASAGAESFIHDDGTEPTRIAAELLRLACREDSAGIARVLERLPTSYDAEAQSQRAADTARLAAAAALTPQLQVQPRDGSGEPGRSGQASRPDNGGHTPPTEPTRRAAPNAAAWRNALMHCRRLFANESIAPFLSHGLRSSRDPHVPGRPLTIGFRGDSLDPNYRGAVERVELFERLADSAYRSVPAVMLEGFPGAQYVVRGCDNTAYLCWLSVLYHLADGRQCPPLRVEAFHRHAMDGESPTDGHFAYLHPDLFSASVAAIDYFLARTEVENYTGKETERPSNGAIGSAAVPSGNPPAEATMTAGPSGTKAGEPAKEDDPDAQTIGKWVIRPGEACLDGGAYFDVDGVLRELLIRLATSDGRTVSIDRLKRACGNEQMEDETLRNHVYRLNAILKAALRVRNNPITSTSAGGAYRLQVEMPADVEPEPTRPTKNKRKSNGKRDRR